MTSLLTYLYCTYNRGWTRRSQNLTSENASNQSSVSVSIFLVLHLRNVQSYHLYSWFSSLTQREGIDKVDYFPCLDLFLVFFPSFVLCSSVLYFWDAMAIVITAEASIAQYNRGPIPTAFSPPNSCLSTYTSAETLGGFYFGNGFSTAGQNLPWDSSCYPTATSTPAVTDADAPWNLYYCL